MRLLQSWSGRRSPLAQLVPNAPTAQVQQPGFEGTDLGIVTEVGQMFGHADQGFLDHLISLVLRQAVLDRKAEDQLSVELAKLVPTALVSGVFDPAQQTGTCGV